MRKPHKYWKSKENCGVEALKYTTRTEFRKYSYGAYNSSRKNKWIDSICGHMLEKINVAGYWTKERCKEDALKYMTRTEFKKKSSASYSIINRNGWSEEICSHMNYKQLPNGYWTKERCLQDSLKYKFRGEFQKKSKSAYTVAYKNGWLSEICSHMIILGSKYKRLIYVYEFSDNNAYVGLTFNIKKRNVNHLSLNEKKLTPVGKHIINSNVLPKLILLTDYLPVEIAQNMERHYIMKYKENGWKLLNKLSGGELGSSR